MCLLNKNFVYIIVIYGERDDFYSILNYWCFISRRITNTSFLKGHKEYAR